MLPVHFIVIIHCGMEVGVAQLAPAWFLKELSPPTSDEIEMRVCRDESRATEDIAMSSVEIYVQ